MIRVLFCIGVNQHFFDATPEVGKQVFYVTIYLIRISLRKLRTYFVKMLSGKASAVYTKTNWGVIPGEKTLPK